MARLRALLTCSAGLEGVLARELAQRLGVRASPFGQRAQPQSREELHRSGKLFCTAMTTRQLYASNVLLRTADRIFVGAATFRATSMWELELACKRLRQGELAHWLEPARIPLKVRCQVAKSKLWHEAAIAERVAGFLSKASSSSDDAEWTPAPPPDVPRQLVLLTGLNDVFTVWLDSSGAPLHERGWRDHGGRMPLRSTVAAGLLYTAGWREGAWGKDAPDNGPKALLDPFAGSGSIPIEAASIAAGLPPHAADEDGQPTRAFALQLWPSFQPGTWAAVMGDVRKRAASAKACLEGRGASMRVVASDRNAAAVRGARGNARRAGVGDVVEFYEGSFSQGVGAAPPEGCDGGLLITNPPWGLRSAADDDGDLRSLYAQLGSLVTAPSWRAAIARDEWRLALLVHNRAHALMSDRTLAPRLRLTVGGKKAWFMMQGDAGRDGGKTEEEDDDRWKGAPTPSLQVCTADNG